MQCIRTRYLGPTNVRPARIMASTNFATHTVSYDHNLNDGENHTAAAQSLLKRISNPHMKDCYIVANGDFQGDTYHVLWPNPTAPK